MTHLAKADSLSLGRWQIEQDPTAVPSNLSPMTEEWSTDFADWHRLKNCTIDRLAPTMESRGAYTQSGYGAPVVIEVAQLPRLKESFMLTRPLYRCVRRPRSGFTWVELIVVIPKIEFGNSINRIH